MAIGTRTSTFPDAIGETRVAKPEWGTKRQCQECGARFYDLNRDPIVCMKCETVFKPVVSSRAKRSRPAPTAPAAPVAPKPEAPPAVPEDLDSKIDTEENLSEDKDEDDVIEDPSELGEDEDDVSEVMDGVEKEKVDT